MKKLAKSGLQSTIAEHPVLKRNLLYGKRHGVLVAKGVVEEVKKRVVQFRNDLQSDRHREGKEAEEKEEKARAAAWAWYQRGKGGKESNCTTRIGGAGGLPTLGVETGGASSSSLHKSSRFKTEALRSPGHGSESMEPSRNWSFSTSGASSLFDAYELDSVSRRIDDAFQGDASGSASPRAPPQSAALVSSSPKIVRRSRRRLQFARSICRKISDVVTHEEMALGVDIRKCQCHKNRPTQSPGCGFRRVSKAIQVLIHLPDCQYHPQQQHIHRRHARELHEHHHHHHQHEHEYHHHVHYQVKLNDGIHYGNSLTRFPAKSGTLAKQPEEDIVKFSRRSPKLSPKVSPKCS